MRTCKKICTPPTSGRCSVRRSPDSFGTSKFYYALWICRAGSKAIPASSRPWSSHLHGRNADWRNLNNADILSMPDNWEYPSGTRPGTWRFGASCSRWIDPAFAKHQLVLLTREWYMHPNGQISAYEWAFGDVNPPVHAWAIMKRVSARPQTKCRYAGRSGISRARLSQAHAEFRLVGESQRSLGLKHLPGRISGPGQHRRIRLSAQSCPPAATSIRQMAPAGWRCDWR